jgi:hypothetical protein
LSSVLIAYRLGSVQALVSAWSKCLGDVARELTSRNQIRSKVERLRGACGEPPACNPVQRLPDRHTVDTAHGVGRRHDRRLFDVVEVDAERGGANPGLKVQTAGVEPRRRARYEEAVFRG